MHLDGARIFEAIEATQLEGSEFSQFTNSLTFCFSKGLCCPTGSIILTDDDIFI